MILYEEQEVIEDKCSDFKCVCKVISNLNSSLSTIT